jgi:hypothetical protein
MFLPSSANPSPPPAYVPPFFRKLFTTPQPMFLPSSANSSPPPTYVPPFFSKLFTTPNLCSSLNKLRQNVLHHLKQKKYNSSTYLNFVFLDNKLEHKRFWTEC